MTLSSLLLIYYLLLTFERAISKTTKIVRPTKPMIKKEKEKRCIHTQCEMEEYEREKKKRFVATIKIDGAFGVAG